LKQSVILKSLLVLLALTGAAQAETRYVSDELTITLRSGQGSDYRVLKSLPSGTKLEVLSQNENTGYSRVLAPDGTEGFSLTRYLMSGTPAQVRVERLEEELAELKAKPKEDVQEKLDKLRSEYQSLKLEYDSLEFENVQLTQRMEAVKKNAANVVDLIDERDKAIQRANRLSTELEELRVEKMELENHSDKKWFMAGAGVLILGLVIGVILPRVGGRRRSGWRSGEFSF